MCSVVVSQTSCNDRNHPILRGVIAPHQVFETAREKAAELAQNAQSTAAAAFSVANGASIQRQAVAVVLAAEREARAPVTHKS
jgi:hypothetical protein